MIKKFIILLLVSLTTSCGYEPIYSKKNLFLYNNFSISSLEYSGDRTVNIRIKNLLTAYTNIEKEQNFTIKLETESLKNVLSKDSKGNPLRYEIQINNLIIVTRNKDGKQINLVFNNSYDYKNSGDVSTLREKEREVKINFAEETAKKLILKLVNFDEY